jgi:hypothetical protein
LSSYTRELKKKKKEMVRRSKLKKLLEDTLEVLSDLKLNGKLTVVTYKEDRSFYYCLISYRGF